MNQYLLTVLVSEKLEEKGRKELLDSLKTKLGEIKKEDLWGSRYLSYPIKHADKAFFVHFEFETEPANIKALDQSLKLNEQIIRYLLLRK